MEARSSPATVPETAFEPVGYVHGNTTEVPLTYPVGVGPITRDVTVYVWVSGYSRTVATGTGTNETAGLVVVSSPNRRVEGQSVNPFAHLSNRELVARLFEVVAEVDNATDARGVLGANVTEVADVHETAVQERTVLGQPAEVVTYAATVRVGPRTTTPAAESSTATGDSETVFVHLMAVEHGDDVVFALGVHDDGMDEAETMAGLIEALEHESGETDA